MENKSANRRRESVNTLKSFSRPSKIYIQPGGEKRKKSKKITIKEEGKKIWLKDEKKKKKKEAEQTEQAMTVREDLAEIFYLYRLQKVLNKHLWIFKKNRI